MASCECFPVKLTPGNKAPSREVWIRTKEYRKLVSLHDYLSAALLFAGIQPELQVSSMMRTLSGGENALLRKTDLEEEREEEQRRDEERHAKKREWEEAKNQKEAEREERIKEQNKMGGFADMGSEDDVLVEDLATNPYDPSSDCSYYQFPFERCSHYSTKSPKPVKFIRLTSLPLILAKVTEKHFLTDWRKELQARPWIPDFKTQLGLAKMVGSFSEMLENALDTEEEELDIEVTGRSVPLKLESNAGRPATKRARLEKVRKQKAYKQL